MSDKTKPFEFIQCNTKVEKEESTDLENPIKVEIEMEDTKNSEKRILYRCTVCTKIFISREMYREHARKHTDEKPYNCQLCPRKFNTRSGKTNHEKTHDNDKKKTTLFSLFVCKTCGKVDIKSYIPANGVLGNKSIKDTCKSCRVEQFKKAKSVEKYPEKQYHCEICSVTFDTTAAFSNHMTIHPKIVYEKVIKCQDCSKVFNRVANLRVHMRKYHPGKLITPIRHRPKDLQTSSSDNKS